uniref:Uncharacterized protein n=2 Tax=Pyxicephalus adspersus TaxID=30357 RepID=A0AAV2ZR91_PYXAD|nr:TPA: hypothetical protein GDO54_003890 [Pyxicephalus adspersus]
MKRIQIIIDSLKTQTLYSNHREKAVRIHDLLDKFDYLKAYVELRQHMLKMVEKQFLVFLEQGKELKIWLSEVAEFQEGLHHVTCSSHHVVQQQLSLTQVIVKQSKMIAEKMEIYEDTANQLTSTLQEMGSFSDVFQTALRKDISQHKKRWSDTLVASVTEEMTQVGERLSAVLKLNTCYQTHLQGLQWDKV